MKHKILKSFKYRIYPNKTQQIHLNQHFGACRFIYNYMLELKIEAYEDYGVSLSVYDLKLLLPGMKKLEEFSWLKDIGAGALCNAVFNLDKAYKIFLGLRKGSQNSSQSIIVNNHFVHSNLLK